MEAEPESKTDVADQENGLQMEVADAVAETAPRAWYCSVKAGVGVVRRTTDLKEAQKALGVGSSNSRQAIIPMVGSKAGDPHDLTKNWGDGSMWWQDWGDINKMQKQCSNGETVL